MIIDNDLSEAEIQLLITLVELQQPIATPNNTHYTFYPKSLEDAAKYFRGFRCDWNHAATSLYKRGYTDKQIPESHLTENGIRIANKIRSLRPPIYYWYREFYYRAEASQAYAHFCEQLYGKNMCQAGFCDKEQMDSLSSCMNLNPDYKVMDLGCGSGMVAEYLSDLSGASFLGVDYIPEAIDTARKRTKAKQNRLEFQVGNFDTLNFPDNSFDAIISLDTLYMPNDLEATMQKLLSSLKPNGKFIAFYINIIEPNGDRSQLLPNGNPLGILLSKLVINYQIQDFTEQTYRMMQRKYSLAKQYQAEFTQEGNEMLYDFLINESLSSDEPYDPDRCNLSRYMYYFQKPC